MASVSVQTSQQRGPMIADHIPENAWEKIGMDYFKFKGKQYLIMTDYMSNWFELAEMARITANVLINECRKQFSHYGVPQTIMADSGPNSSQQNSKTSQRNGTFQ